MQTLPVHLDLFALIMLLGVAQGVFLGGFFLTRSGLTGDRRRQVANRCLGFFMLALTAICAEILLNYTNYTFRLLWTVDFAEPFNFVIGPLFYFFVFSRLRHRLPRGWFWHFVPFVIWLANAVTWLYQPPSFKYNAYNYSWHPDLPRVVAKHYLEEDFTGLRPFINEMTLLSCVVYAVLALLTIRQIDRQQRTAGAARVHTNLRMLSWLFALVPILIALVKPQFYRDLGDYLLASYITVTIYATSFLVMRGSDFLNADPPQPASLPEPAGTKEPAAEPKKKYEKSALPEEVEDALMAKLNQLLETEKPYLHSDLSLPRLAERLNTTPHHLSQLLNDRLGQTFFDWLATHRITEAQILLNNPANTHLKIDEIAERVGYNSPSAFHTAFKRLTSLTPAQFRAHQLAKKIYRE